MLQLRFRPLVLALCSLSLPALAATPITGTVTNKTTGKPAAGDDVVLIRLAQGMQESTRTKTDSKGHYTLEVPDEGLHLIRVMHDKANYFRPAPPGTQSVDLEVYNAAEHVKGVSTEAEVMRIQTDPSGTSLKVVENFFVKNESEPALTQFSNQPFDFYLPEGAVVEGSAALAPGGMPVQAAPVPLADKGHFTFIFPIRPGETRFQVTYHLPYSGKIDLVPKLPWKVGTIALMMPKAMKFTPVPGSPFSSVDDEVNAQTFVARNVAPGSPLSFTLTGTGQLPRDSQNPDQGSGQQGPAAGGAAAGGSDAPVAATENTKPGKGIDNPLDPDGNRTPLDKYKYWILAGLLLAFAVAAGILLRKPATPSLAGGTPPPVPPTNYPPVTPVAHGDHTLNALKEELFSLETERLEGKLSEAEYASQKLALETVLKRALARRDSGKLGA
ncbi:carboxypeptidase-like regulatory domain-containing protein [Granulicella cerasi]|uniref:Carboxypeptidase-like regulatory domain-containing protein n=1 Tax=Granulicella cerasi TaxID=741063 RepID=A0ABW1Z484_9BACT|nr:carboxypeptidase-like regulatory domain-containing protein [Granulicella cerasi]